MTVLFRFTIYQANGTTPDLTVTSQRGGSNPYIVDVPSGDGQEVDLLTGAVRSGAYVVTVADIVTGTDGTGTVRLITNKLEDNQFRQQLLSRRAKLECSRDGGSTYAIWTLGYLTGIQQVDAITYSFTVSDSRRIESTHTIFTWSSDPLAATDERREFPNRGCLVGGPTIQNFGPIRASGGWEFAWREVQSGYLALAFVAAYDPPSYARTVTPPLAKIKAAMQRFYEKQPPIADLTGDNYKQIRERQFVNAYPSVLAIVESGASVWYGTVRGMFTPPSYSLTGTGQTYIPPYGEMNYLFVQLTPGQSTSYPSTNAKVRVRLVSQEVAPESALYIDEHPIDIVSKLYETVNIPFNAASVTSTKAAVGTDVRLALRITEPVNMGEFLSSSIFGPFGFSVRTNAAGEQEFFPTRISNSATPSVTIANADIVGDTPPAIYDLDESTVVTGFRLTSTSFSVFDQDPELRDPPPPDGLTAQEVTIAAQNADTSTYSTKEVAYKIGGMIHDGSPSNGAFAFSPEVVQRFFTGIVAEGFDRFGRGAVASEVQVLASSAAANLQVGDEVNIAASYYPNKNYRIGESNVGNRIAQIVRRTETPEGPSYKLVDSGVSSQPTAPTFTLAAWSGEPRRIASATVTNAATLNGSNLTLAVQYQISATTPTTRTGTLFTRFRPGTIPTIAFTLPVVPPGSRVYVRMRTEKTELRASAWTAWTYVDLGAWVAPNSLTTSNVTANAVTLTIGLGSPTPNTSDPLDVFAYPGASAPADWTAYRIGTLSAGSTSTVIRDLTPSTQYTFGVAFRDEGTGAYSGFATATVTTASVNTVSAPAAPKMKLYTSFPNAGQTTGIALTIGAVEGYNIVIQRAPDVAGAPGTWADLDTLPPLTATYVDVLPSDGITRWYRVFYRLSGFLDGTPGTARSGTPIGIPDDFFNNTQASSIAGQATLTLGNYLTGGSYDGSASVTTNVDATPNATASKVVARDASGNFSAGTITAALAGNATTATTLQTARNINGVAFDGSADITVTAAAGTLTGNTLASGVTASSLTSVGTIDTGVWQGTSIGKNYGGTGLTSTAFAGITNERVVAYDGASGTYFIAAAGSNGQALVYTGGALAWGNPAPGPHVLATTTGLGTDHTVSGLTSGMILQATGATTARFQTPSIPASSVTAGTFGGTAYTVTNDLTVSGTLTASLTGNASTATVLQTARTINGVSFDGSANITVAAAAGTLTGNTLAAGVLSSSLTSVGTLTDLTVTNPIAGSVTGNAGSVTNGVYTTGSYADPSWITSLAGSKISGNISGNAANVTGTVAIANGGTNATSYGATGTGTRAIVYDIVSNAFEAVAAGSSGQFLQSAGTTGDITWATPPNFSTTTTTAGYVPGSNGAGATYFLNANGGWSVPAVGSVSANNVTAGTFSGAAYTFSNSVTFTSGVRVANGETYKILNGAGTAIDVLSATTLGAGVINSSLTSVGTLTSGALGAGFTAIDNARLANSSIIINGTSVSLGGSITVDTSKWTASGSDIYYNTGNVSVGTTPPAGWRLFVRGAGATNATYGFGVENSSQTALFTVRNDGAVSVPNGVFTANSHALVGTATRYNSEILGVQISDANNLSTVKSVLRLSNNGSGRIAKLTMTDNAIIDGIICLVPVGATTSYWSFGFAGGPESAMIIRSDGNVGINTTSPTVALDVANAKSRFWNVAVGGTASGTYAPYTDSVVGFGNLHLATQGSGAVYINSAESRPTYINPVGGNVGIGTTSPNVLLEVAGLARFTGTGGFSIGEDAAQNRIRTISGSRFAFYNSSDVLTGLAIRSLGVGATYGTIATPTSGAIIEGNVGIGTSSPTYKLEVAGGATKVNAYLSLGDNAYIRADAASWMQFQMGTNGARFMDSSNTTAYVTIDGSGNMFLRNSSSNVVIGNSVAGDMYLGGGSANTGNIYLQTGSSLRVAVLSSGNVGIGTTSPSSNLEAFGTDAGIIVHNTGNSRGGIYALNTQRFALATTSVNDDIFFGYGSSPVSSAGFTSRMMIDNGTGNVGIGTTTTTGGGRVWIRGDEGQPATSGTTQNGILRVHAGSTEGWGETLDIGMHIGVSGPASYAWLQSTNTDGLGINYNLALNPNGGNVGIGTASPGYRLDVAGQGRFITNSEYQLDVMSASSAAGASIRRYSTSGYAYDVYETSGRHWRNGILGSTSYTIFDQSALSARVTIDTSGNVGIGNTSPGAVLNVGGTGTLHFTESGIGSMILKGSSGTARGLFEVHNANASSRAFLQAYNGGAGVGTLSNTFFDIATNSSGRIRILGTGAVLVNTETHWNNETLSVQRVTDGTLSTVPALVRLTNHGGGRVSKLLFTDSAIIDGIICMTPVSATGSYFSFGFAGQVEAAMIVRSDGNVGIGTTSPAEKLTVVGRFNLTSGGYGWMYANDVNHSIIMRGDRNGTAADYTNYYQYGGSLSAGLGHKFWTGGVLASQTLKFQIADDATYNPGDFFVGATAGWASSRMVVQTGNVEPAAEFNGTGNTAGQAPVYVWNNVESGSTYFISFYSDGQNNPRTLRGYINYRRDNATLNLTTASDYRIKTVYGAYTKSGEIFDKVKVHEASINGEGNGRYPMVLAHELQEAYPSAVDGEKDAVNEDGTPKLQMVSYTAMIPVMLAEIKSLRARVAELEAR